MSFTPKITPYETYKFDLSSERDDEPLAVVGMANSLTVMSAPSAFSLKLNEVGNKSLDAVKGLKADGISITEIFITNAIGSGEGKIFISWLG